MRSIQNSIFSVTQFTYTHTVSTQYEHRKKSQILVQGKTNFFHNFQLVFSHVKCTLIHFIPYLFFLKPFKFCFLISYTRFSNCLTIFQRFLQFSDDFDDFTMAENCPRTDDGSRNTIFCTDTLLNVEMPLRLLFF